MRRLVRCSAILLAMLWWLLCPVSSITADWSAPWNRGRETDLTAEWEKPRPTNLKDFYNLYNPRIVEVPGSVWRYRMWFFGWATGENNPQPPDGTLIGDAIYHARARALDQWEVYAGRDPRGHAVWDRSGDASRWVPVVRSKSECPWTNAAVGDPSVVYHRGRYYMALSAVGFEPHADVKPQRLYMINSVMGATSRNGIDWELTPRPIALWNREMSIRFDLNDPHARPPKGYYGGYHRPSLMLEGNRWKLWFDYYHPEAFLAMGYAECSGEFTRPEHWHVLRSGRHPCLMDWPNPSVIRVGKRYLAFADAPWYPSPYGGDGRLITMAESIDGLNWNTLGHIRPEGLASSHVPEAFLRTEPDGDWLYLFYAWKPETRPDTPWDFRYKAIRYVRKRVAP